MQEELIHRNFFDGTIRYFLKILNNFVNLNDFLKYLKYYFSPYRNGN